MVENNRYSPSKEEEEKIIDKQLQVSDNCP